MTQRSIASIDSASTPMSGARLFLRWMFILIVALDLISSPWHAHRHEGAPETTASQVDHADHAVADVDHLLGEDGDLAHADGEKPLKIGHSVTGVRGASVQLAASASISDWVLPPATSILPELLAESEVKAPSSWATQRKRPRLPSFRALPPDGRAPPFLLA